MHSRGISSWQSLVKALLFTHLGSVEAPAINHDNAIIDLEALVETLAIT